jgi:SAM-dependent methyltransferase
MSSWFSKWMNRQWIRNQTRWLSKRRSRRAPIIQEAIQRLGAAAYLEIGVNRGDNFARIDVLHKSGVDPIPPADKVLREVERGALYFAMTSDEFFGNQERLLATRGIDVALVDGLHTYRQSLADVENCLRWLNPGGIIFMHDCCPSSAAMATPAETAAELERYRAAHPRCAWTGDVWKTIVRLRSTRPDLRACVLDCDFGIGVVFPGRTEGLLDFTPEQIETMSYGDLAADRRRLLGLRHPWHLVGLLREAGRNRLRTGRMAA